MIFLVTNFEIVDSQFLSICCSEASSSCYCSQFRKHIQILIMQNSSEEGQIEELQTTGFKFIADKIINQEESERKVSKRSKKKKFMQKINKQKMETIINKGIPTLPIEYFPLNSPLFMNGYPSLSNNLQSYPMLVKVTKKNFFEPRLYELQLSDEEKNQMKQLPKAVRKFYLKRNFLFSKFKQGIQLDEESWYSVIPECISKYIVQRLKSRLEQLKWKQVFVRDGFCGSGGLAIPLAQEFKNFIASDLDQIKIQNLLKNMKVYGLDFKGAECADFLKLQPSTNPSQTILIMCPPWGGTTYIKQSSFDLDEDMKPTFSMILEKAIQLSDNFVIQLPRNIKIKQLVTIFQRILPEKVKRFSLELETIYINEQINQIFVYFGDISSINYSQEVDLIHKNANIDIIDRHNIKNKLKSKDLKDIYKNIKIEDQFNEGDFPLDVDPLIPQLKKKIKKPKSQVKQWSLQHFMKSNKNISQKYEDI